MSFYSQLWNVCTFLNRKTKHRSPKEYILNVWGSWITLSRLCPSKCNPLDSSLNRDTTLSLNSIIEKRLTLNKIFLKVSELQNGNTYWKEQ
jgi:hypothetical protein